MSTSTIVRPEFQLIVAGVDFVSPSGVQVKAGTVYGRLYFPENCEVTGSFKGTIIKDSWQSGAKYSTNRKCRAIEFLATPEVYSTLYNSCAKSNTAANRMRTVALLEKCLAAPAAVRVEVTPVYATLDWVVQSVDEIESEVVDVIAIAKSRMPVLDDSFDCNEADRWEVCKLERQFGLSGNVQSVEPLVNAPAIFASDWTTEELHKCSVKQLKVIGSKLGIKVYGTKVEIIAKIQSSH